MQGVALVAALALVAANGFFVATEFALARTRVSQVRELERAGRPGARSLRHAIDHLDAYLAACQLGITLASIGLGVLAEPAFERLFEPVFGPLGNASHVIAFGFAFGLVTLLHVVFGELAPKSLAIARNTGTALVVAPPMRLFYLAAKPVIDGFNWLGNLVLRPFGIPPASEAGHAPHTETELRELLQESLDRGLVEATDVELTEGAFVLGDRDVQDVMVPRPDVVSIPVDLPAAECLTRVLESPFTRYPCYRETPDRIVGILHIRDLFAAVHARRPEHVELAELLRPAQFVPETKKAAALLAELRRSGQHMAIVADEYGATQGIVTLEDLIEEIVGEIEDEYDEPDGAAVVRLDDRRILLEGTFAIDDFNERFLQDLPADDYHTVGGFVFGELGHGAAAGDSVLWNGLRFSVVEVEGTRIDRLEVEFEEPPPPAAARP